MQISDSGALNATRINARTVIVSLTILATPVNNLKFSNSKGTVVLTRKCRFCLEEIQGDSEINDICRRPDCLELSKNACLEVKSCNHNC